MNDLAPERDVYRFLFASPAQFVGECDGKGFHLTPAFPSFGRRIASNQSRRFSTFALSFRSEPQQVQSIKIESYEWVGEEVSALIGGFYGKLVYNFGHIQCAGRITVPTSIEMPVQDRERYPFNSAPRKPDGVGINLFEARRLMQAYITENDSEYTGLLLRAAEFYRLALEVFHSRPEIALAMLCSTLEALLPLRAYSEKELYDNTLLSTFERIKKHCPHGSRVARGLKSRLYQVKRKIVALVSHFVDDSFFDQRETKLAYGIVKDREDLVSRVKCVYDLRSKVLHAADRRGLWYLQSDHDLAEIGVGAPVLQDAKLEKMLTNALTLTGFERVVSTVLRAALREWSDQITPRADDNQATTIPT